MRIISENSQATIEEERTKKAAESALWEVDKALRTLTANLLRVTRGAGKPWEIADQVRDLFHAFASYAKDTGHLPSPDALSAILDIEPAVHDRGSILDGYSSIDSAELSVIRGALQIAASRLVGQDTQASRGRSEMHDGIDEVLQYKRQTFERLAREKQARNVESAKTTLKIGLKKAKPKSPKSPRRGR